MPYIAGISRESCRGSLAYDPANPGPSRACASRGTNAAYPDRPWTRDPAAVAAYAGEHGGLAFRDALCIGCTRLYDRLVTEGALQ